MAIDEDLTPKHIKNTKKEWSKRTDELLSKSVIPENVTENLHAMINSEDVENLTLAREIVRLKISNVLLDGLNTGQKEGFVKIVDYLEAPSHDIALIKGYAGTGKTHLVKRIVEYLTVAHSKYRIAITAPTNKAVSVLHRNSPFNNSTSVFEEYGRPDDQIVYCTIHKLLNLKESIDNLGNRKFVTEVANTNDINRYNCVIVDEVSMLDDNMFLQLMKYKDTIRFIFMGGFRPCKTPLIDGNSLKFYSPTISSNRI